MGKGFAELLHSIPCKKDPGREIMFSHCFPNYFKCQLKRLLRFLFQTEVLTGTARGSQLEQSNTMHLKQGRNFYDPNSSFIIHRWWEKAAVPSAQQ